MNAHLVSSLPILNNQKAGSFPLEISNGFYRCLTPSLSRSTLLRMLDPSHRDLDLRIKPFRMQIKVQLLLDQGVFG